MLMNNPRMLMALIAGLMNTLMLAVLIIGWEAVPMALLALVIWQFNMWQAIQEEREERRLIELQAMLAVYKARRAAWRDGHG